MGSKSNREKEVQIPEKEIDLWKFCMEFVIPAMAKHNISRKEMMLVIKNYIDLRDLRPESRECGNVAHIINRQEEQHQ